MAIISFFPEPSRTVLHAMHRLDCTFLFNFPERREVQQQSVLSFSPCLVQHSKHSSYFLVLYIMRTILHRSVLSYSTPTSRSTAVAYILPYSIRTSCNRSSEQSFLYLTQCSSFMLAILNIVLKVCTTCLIAIYILLYASTILYYAICTLTFPNLLDRY